MSSALSSFDRQRARDRLEDEEYDVLVVGGGITGAGVALDAVARGLSTALVEGRDFASGTSSRSSKLVHGGLRYLQQREVRLVYENLAERQRLLRNARHLVTPLPFVIPLFGRGGVADRALARAYSSALWTYDLTGGLRIGRRHRRIGKAEVARHFPTLRTDRLAAGFLYWDARADDARLTLAVVRTAVLDHGAVAANYCPVTSLVKRDGKIRGAVLADGGEVRARVVVNATGVWAGRVATMDDPSGAPAIRPAKGVHVSVERSRLPCDVAAVLPVRGDRRTIFVVPWGEEVYIGTTDTDYDGPTDEPGCDEDDVSYLLEAVNEHLSAPLTPDDVRGRWAGLRPLLAQDRHGRTPSARTADLSRRHSVTVSGAGLVTVTGGKLTTYRKMAADTVDAALRALGRPARRCPTARLALRGSAPDPSGRRLGPGAPEQHLASRYGSESGDVWQLAKVDPRLAARLVEGLPYLEAEVVWAARHEMAQTVEDVLARRTRALLHRGHDALAAAPRVAALMGAELGWSASEAARQVEHARGMWDGRTPA